MLCGAAAAGAGRRAMVLGALAGLALAGPAAAQTDTGGASPDAPAADSAPAGAPAAAPAYGRPAPRVARIACRAGCGAGAARPGALIRVYGSRLGQADEVIFLGATGDADDASVAPREVGRRSLVAQVPHTAATGSVAIARRDGTRSAASSAPLVIESAALAPPAGVVDAEVQGRKVFYGAQPAELSYVLGGDQPARVEIELLRAPDGYAVARWSPGEVPPGVPQTVTWNGVAEGEVAPDGVYEFRVTATDATGAIALSSAKAAPDRAAPGAFTFLRHHFPILGAHRYGKGAARFGGGRGHQGHDVFAACGTPVVAARGGSVKFKQYHGAAGYYVVIDGAATGTDFAYMHLRAAALVGKGDRVRTGQLIGYVGDTGRASGCHLHFEAWSAPGWYSGGKPMDPLDDLLAWDAQS